VHMMTCFFARDDALHQLDDLGVDGRLAAAHRDHRRAALVDRREALGERQAVLQVARVAFRRAADAARLQVWSGSSMSTTGTCWLPPTSS